MSILKEIDKLKLSRKYYLLQTRKINDTIKEIYNKYRVEILIEKDDRRIEALSKYRKQYHKKTYVLKEWKEKNFARKVPIAEHKKIIELKEQGKTLQYIADIYGISREAIRLILKRNGTKSREYKYH